MYIYKSRDELAVYLAVTRGPNVAVRNLLEIHTTKPGSSKLELFLDPKNRSGGLEPGKCLLKMEFLNAMLWKAAVMGRGQKSNILLEYGADIGVELSGSLACAARLGDMDEIDRLIKLGANVRSQESYALQMALVHNRPQAAGLLCLRGADINEAMRGHNVIATITGGGLAYEEIRQFAKRKQSETTMPPQDHPPNPL